MNVVMSGEVAHHLPVLINPDVEQIAVDDQRYLDFIEDRSKKNDKLEIFGEKELDRIGPGGLVPGWLKAEFASQHARLPEIIGPKVAKFGGPIDHNEWNEIGGEQKFTGWLRRYVDHYRAEAEELDGRMDGILDEFGNRLVDTYPFVSASTVEDRLKRTSVSYYDFIYRILKSGIQTQGSRNKYVYGRYCLESSHMYIGLDEGDSFTTRDRIISHEAVHAVSGRSIQLVDKVLPSGEIKRAVKENRLGLLGFDYARVPFNMSINEAVTEYINLALYGHDLFRAVYPDERGMFTNFLFCGLRKIDPELVIRAYMENEDPEMGNPAMEELEAEVCTAYGQNVLAVIDGTIRNADNYTQGLLKAKEYLRGYRSRNIMDLAGAVDDISDVQLT